MYDSLASACKTFVSIIGGAHCYFANTNIACDVGEDTSSTGISITRGDQHDVTFDFVNPWLDYTLKGDCNAFVEFNVSLQNSPRITFNQACVPNPVPGINANGNVLTSSTIGVSYQWYLDGNPIPNTNSITITATTSGNYEVEVFYADGCSETSAHYAIVISGVNELEEGSINIFPNPASSFINLDLPDNQKWMVTILDFTGKDVLMQLVDNKRVDITALPSGMYMLQIQSEELVYTTKIVKK